MLSLLLLLAGFLLGRLYESRTRAARQRRAMLAHMARQHARHPASLN